MPTCDVAMVKAGTDNCVSIHHTCHNQHDHFDTHRCVIINDIKIIIIYIFIVTATATVMKFFRIFIFKIYSEHIERRYYSRFLWNEAGTRSKNPKLKDYTILYQTWETRKTMEKDEWRRGEEEEEEEEEEEQ